MAIRLDNFQLFQRDTMIKSLAIKQVGANETLRRLQAIGLPMRRQALLKTYREYAQIPVKAERIKFVRKDFRLSSELYTEPVVTPAGRPAWISDRYRYTVEFTTFNPDTEELRDLGHTMISSKPLTPRQIEDAFINSLTDAVDRYKLTITKYNIAIAEHRPGDPWD